MCKRVLSPRVEGRTWEEVLRVPGTCLQQPFVHPRDACKVWWPRCLAVDNSTCHIVRTPGGISGKGRRGNKSCNCRIGSCRAWTSAIIVGYVSTSVAHSLAATACPGARGMYTIQRGDLGMCRSMYCGRGGTDNSVGVGFAEENNNNNNKNDHRKYLPQSR